MSLSNRELLAAKVETNYGDDAFGGSAPTSWLAPIRDTISIKPQTEEVADESVRAVFSPGDSQFNKVVCDVSFETKLTGKAGAAGTAPGWGDLLKAAGCIETITASTDAQYDPRSGNPAADASVSLYHSMLDDVDDTVAYNLLVTGVRLTPTFRFEVGAEARIAWEGKGLWTNFPSAGSPPADPSEYQGNKKGLKVAAITATIGGTSVAMTGAEFAFNWTVEEDRDATANALVDEVLLGRSEPAGGSFSLKGGSHTLGTLIPAIPAGTAFAIVITLTDGTDTFTLTIGRAQFTDWSKASGVRPSFDLPFIAVGTFGGADTGNNDWNLKFT